MVQGPAYLGTAPAAAVSAAPHQLPSPPPDFTGRVAELAELRGKLGGGGAAIFGVRGAGGIGKTALALKLAEELAPRYPDTQLYLDLKGVTQPLTVAEAMGFVIRAFHPETQLPESEAELAGLYRSVFHDRRVLLLLDNARDQKQVEPLVPPGAGSLLLVTSRLRFTLPGLHAKDLDELPEDDAVALLRKIAPRIGAAAGEIARLCGRLPIALRLAGSALAEQPWLPPAEYARRLGDARERLGLVEGALATSCDLLDEEHKALWRALAVFPGTFDAPAAAAVWEREARAAEAALGALAQRSLVEWEGEGGEQGEDGRAGRFRLHDLARDFAGARLGAEEGQAARRRHAAHYVEVLRAADKLYLKGGEAVLQGLRLFDREWGNAQAGQAWVAADAAADDEAAGLCSAYPDAGACLLLLRQHPRERVAWLEAALAGARRRRDRAAEGRHLGNLGIACAHLGDTRRAIENYQQRLAIAREIGDRNGEGYVLGNLGSAYAELGETRRAIDHQERCLAIAREVGDRNCEGYALGNLGLAYAALGETRRAIAYHEQYLTIAREIGDRRGEGYALGCLGSAYAALGETRRAIAYHGQYLTIAREIGDRRSEGIALGSLGLAYAALGEMLRAIAYHEQYLAIAREIGDRRNEAIASWNLGLAYEQQGELARAAGLMQSSVDYERSIGHADAEKHAARLAALRARIASGGGASETQED